MVAPYPGGVLVARVRSRRPIGPATFVLEGRRSPLYSGPSGLRALIPVPVTMIPGPATLGLEIRGRRGRRRIPVEVTIVPRSFVPRIQAIPEGKRPLLELPERVRDSRLVLAALRTESPVAHATGPLRPPVDAEPSFGFGGLETYEGAAFVPLLMDGLYGDHHRGLDYAVPAGTPVRAPGAGVVLLAQPLTFTGHTIVLDHGRGVISAVFHLRGLQAAVGDKVEAGAIIASSGDSGLTPAPVVHWGVYLHGVAIDPRVLGDVG
jgi:murein DD-endopeptidase MepM/ murein hydrolase activator NlpD